MQRAIRIPVQASSGTPPVFGLESGELATKYENLYTGQRHMNAGNRIRSAFKRGNITADDLVTTSSPTEDADHV